MALVAPMVDGELQTRTDSGDSLATKKNNSTIDSDMFLTLLVAEMQNQDPLEPTSNTEWVSQYATFTQVQKMSEMGESMDQLRANSLIGKEVVVSFRNSATGEVNSKKGVVEYVSVEDGKSILVIDGEKYSLDDLDSVISDEYSKAYDLYSEFVAKMEALPPLDYISKSYADVVQELYDFVNGLDEYQQSFMKTYAGDEVALLVNYIAKLRDEYGVEFVDISQKKETTLDDILLSFNTRMDAILEKIKLLSETVEETSKQMVEMSGKSSQTVVVYNNAEENKTSTDAADKTETPGDTTDKVEAPGDTTGDTGATEDTTDKTEQESGSGDGASENTGSDNQGESGEA
ncbi:MAG: hypothetical protein NC337_10925 [Roseburia sp.]|nr:hypothetical protein [Roseburia sp.]